MSAEPTPRATLLAVTALLAVAAGSALVAARPGRAAGDVVPAIALVAAADARADHDAPPRAVEVRGLDAATVRGLAARRPDDPAWTAAIALHVEPSGAGGAGDSARDRTLPPVLARYEARDGAVRLTPRFPLETGVAYRVRVDRAALARLAGVRGAGASAADAPAADAPVAATPTLERRFAVPRREPARTTRVVAVHPAASRVPANLLRWYVELSAPMAPGEALDHVRLLDEAGHEVRGAFLRLDQELWDPSLRRVTVLFDPGRVKRGIRTNLEAGAPLVAGRRYRLVIDAGWPDGRGARLASGFEHAFEATAEDRDAVDVARWRLAAPRAATRDPLRVAFGEPLDHALVARLLAVHAADGGRVEGAAEPEPGDSAWRFVPAAPWGAGAHALRARAALEDLAGNSLARVFDADRRAGDRTTEGTAGAGVWREVRFVVR